MKEKESWHFATIYFVDKPRKIYAAFQMKRDFCKEKDDHNQNDNNIIQIMNIYKTSEFSLHAGDVVQ